MNDLALRLAAFTRLADSKDKATPEPQQRSYLALVEDIPTPLLTAACLRLAKAATYGFPIEMTVELAEERGQPVDVDGYNEAMAKHREVAAIISVFVFYGAGPENEEDIARIQCPIGDPSLGKHPQQIAIGVATTFLHQTHQATTRQETAL